MCNQAVDHLVLEGVEHVVAGHRGDEPFHPRRLQLEHIALSTGCYRGFCCSYEVVDDRLLLRQLALGLDDENLELAERGVGPVRMGTVPRHQDREWCVYENLAEPVPFSGELLVRGEGFEGTPLGCVDPVLAATRLVGLHFVKGELVLEVDHATSLAAMRLRAAQVDDSDSAASAELCEIARPFLDQRYRLPERDYAEPFRERR